MKHKNISEGVLDVTDEEGWKNPGGNKWGEGVEKVGRRLGWGGKKVGR